MCELWALYKSLCKQKIIQVDSSSVPALQGLYSCNPYHR